VLKLIDDEAEEEEPKTKGKGRAKAKALWREVESEEDSGNESMGSLRDFIVPDDEGSESGSESERAPSPGPRRKRVEVLPKPKPEAKAKASNTKASTKIIEILDSDSDEDAVENVLGNVQDNEDEDDGGASDTGSVLHYSPPPRVRKLALPDLSALTLSDNDDSPSGSSTPAMTPKSRAKAATKIKAKAGPPGMSKKEWEAYRVQCAQAFFDDLDRDVFEFRLGAEGVGATLEWSAHLRTSAGNAQRKR
jgi:hypothetical protein